MNAVCSKALLHLIKETLSLAGRARRGGECEGAVVNQDSVRHFAKKCG